MLSYLGIRLVTRKVLKNLSFSGYSLTCVLISFQQKHSKSQLFRIPSHLGMHVVRAKAMKKSQLFRIPSHFGIHLLTPKHSKISTFQNTLSLMNQSSYTETTKIFQLFRILSDLDIHLLTLEALRNCNFLGNPFTLVFISLHDKHFKISTFQRTLSVGYAFRYTISTEKPRRLSIPS